MLQLLLQGQPYLVPRGRFSLLLSESVCSDTIQSSKTKLIVSRQRTARPPLLLQPRSLRSWILGCSFLGANLAWPKQMEAFNWEGTSLQLLHPVAFSVCPLYQLARLAFQQNQIPLLQLPCLEGHPSVITAMAVHLARPRPPSRRLARRLVVNSAKTTLSPVNSSASVYPSVLKFMDGICYHVIFILCGYLL